MATSADLTEIKFHTILGKVNATFWMRGANFIINY